MIQLTHNIVNQPYPNIKLKIKKDLQSFLLWLLTTVTKISLIILHFYLQCHLKYSRTMLERKQIVCDILREACKSKYYFSPHSKDLLDTQSQNFVWALSFPLTVTWVLCINQLYFISRKKKSFCLSLRRTREEALPILLYLPMVLPISDSVDFF